ncbi:PQQ-binding-like beta-propeller repeat protein [Micromonospora sp. NPDC051296]|uniref:outer membrane protein assembly factor BamB family protein n=1 Tax=Micromonospora sp. NPDC051296 TaxID=3155046 RepID=UPI003417F83F
MHATLPGSLASDLILAEDQIFTVAPRPGVTDGTQDLVAYPRPERATVTPQRLAPLWRIPVPAGHVVLRAESVDDLGVLVSTARSRTVAPLDTTETMLLDISTGQQRWRAPGFATLHASGRVLLQTFGSEEPLTLGAVELASGRELWSTWLPAGAWPAYHERDGMVDAIVVSTAAGDVEVLDPGTGAVRHRLPALDDEPAGHRNVAVFGDLVLVIRNQTTVTAYDLDGLVQRWEATVSLASYVTPCGALVCARSSDGGLHLLDPDTGAVRGSTEQVDVVLAGSGRALATTSGSSDALGVIAVDPATGKQLADYGVWDLVGSYEYLPHLLGVRALPEIGLLLARFDPAEPQPRRVDVLTGATGGCQYRYDLIACRRGDGSFGIWQLRG